MSIEVHDRVLEYLPVLRLECCEDAQLLAQESTDVSHASWLVHLLGQTSLYCHAGLDWKLETHSPPSRLSDSRFLSFSLSEDTLELSENVIDGSLSIDQPLEGLFFFRAEPHRASEVAQERRHPRPRVVKDVGDSRVRRCGWNSRVHVGFGLE